MIHLIKSMLNIKFEELPNSDCIEIESWLDKETGKLNKKYSLNLVKKEFDIFDKLDFIDHDSNHKTLILHSKSFSIENIEKITTVLYKLLGDDSMGQTGFTIDDKQNIEEKFWSGTSWHNDKYYVGLDLIGSDDESRPELQLVIKW